MAKQFDKPSNKKAAAAGGKKAAGASDKKKKSTMKMQKKHQKQEVAVKDVQLKVGPTKRISKVAKTSAPAAAAATAAKTETVPKKVVVAPAPSSEPLVELRDTVKDQLAFNKQKKVDQGALKKAIKKLDDKAKRVPLKNTAQNRTVYVGHLPHGLLEEQLKSYFAQYGTVTGLKVARSRKTARSKGYAFIQFELPEVAAIAAKAMHGHMVLGKVLDVHVLQGDSKNPFSFRDGKKQYKFINWKRIFVKEVNEEKTPADLKKQVVSLLVNEKKKRQMLQKAGIEYTFPGFQAIVDGTDTANVASAVDEE